MKRLFVICAAVLIVTAAPRWFRSVAQSPEAQQLTVETTALLKPAICNGNALTRLFTIVPSSPLGRVTVGSDTEQISLIYTGERNRSRRVWVLRLPEAFITQRPCDTGRQNWSGTLGQDDIHVSQIFHLDLVVVGSDVLPATLASKAQRLEGFPATVTLMNNYRAPVVWHKSVNVALASVTDWLHNHRPPCCREDESDIPGLVRLKPNVPWGTPLFCSNNALGTQWETKGYVRKNGPLDFEFITECVVNCTLKMDYKGWEITLAIPFSKLREWESGIAGIKNFLDQHTAYLDEVDQKPAPLQ